MLLPFKARSNSDPTVAQKWRMTRTSPQNKRPPLNEARLRDLALHYVGRFATTRAKLLGYLSRKIRERGWEGDSPPDVEAMAARMVELNYIDDASYALMKGAAMSRRGLGPRRVRQGLRADGVVEDDRQPAEEQAHEDKWQAAEILARRKRIGPYAAAPADQTVRQKQIAMFARAGHDFATARAWVEAAPGEMPERDQ
jgi:regulatory protein